ncbi:MAG: SLBB domain-containing protein, partial [Chloroflexi bacterium]|nr:SLBB domain-containing protein [Chloroflexota bacterium]
MADGLERYRWLIVALFAVPLLVGIGFLLNERLSGPEPLQLNMGDVPAGDLRVYVAGAVQRPGVYPLRDGDRWIDALEAAGGPSADADLAAVNLARRARDEDQIVVPYQGQAAQPGAPVAVAGTSQAPLININSASQADLESLPGIGEVRATNIMRSRTTDGAFASTEDLLTRKLIP